MTAKDDSVRRAMGMILPLCVLSLLLAGAVCSIANDMYAFVKKDIEIEISIEASYNLKDFSKLLEKKGIVNNPTVFMMYVKSKDKIEAVESFSGEITLNSSMSYREILSSLS